MITGRLVGPWLVLAAGVSAAVLSVVTDQVRVGGFVLAAAFAATAVLRLVLPARAAGAAAVRSRTTDVIGLGVAALAAAALTATLKLTP